MVQRSSAPCMASGRLKEFITLSPYEGDGVMPFSGIADPTELALLKAVFDDVGNAASIEVGSPDADSAAA